jgi:DNA polymerase I-like protein with 3'-5' exonuclease and polymerase domains
MVQQEVMFKKHGYVKSMFGRIRRFDEAHAIYKRYGDKLLDSMWAKRNGLVMERQIVKKALNAAKNHPIQSACSSVINRAIIEFGQWSEESGLDIRFLLTVHDENVIDCDESVVDVASEKLKYYMENNKYAKMLSVPMVATPIVADNLAGAK